MDKNWKKWLLIITTIIGVLISIELVKIFYDANFVPDSAPSFCAISEKIDCDAVARSPYAIFFGVPFAVWGLLFYLFILFIAFADKLAKIPFLKILEVFKNPQSYLYCLALFSVIFSIGLAGLSTFVLHKACILCYVTYILNAIILFSVWDKKGIKYHLKVAFEDFKEAVSSPFNVGLLSVFVILFSGLLLFVNLNQTFIPKTPMNFKLDKKFKKAEFGNVLGDSRARLIVHEYTDFQCPFCAISNAMMIRAAGELNNIMIMHHDYPLDSTCNPYVPRSVHKNSCLMSKYSIASRYQGKYWDFNILLFENNRKITERRILNIAKEAGLDVEELKKDAYSKEVEEELQADIENAHNIGVEATPTIRIGMKKYEGIVPYYELRERLIRAGAKVK